MLEASGGWPSDPALRVSAVDVPVGTVPVPSVCIRSASTALKS